MQEKHQVSEKLELNIEWYKQIYEESADIKMQEMSLGTEHTCRCFLAYIEVSLKDRKSVV